MTGPNPAANIEQAIRVSKRLLELHERGPMGRIEVHRLARNDFDVCPVCREVLIR